MTVIALGLIFGAQFFSHALTATENSAISQGLTGCAVILKRRSTALMQHILPAVPVRRASFRGRHAEAVVGLKLFSIMMPTAEISRQAAAIEPEKKVKTISFKPGVD